MGCNVLRKVPGIILVHWRIHHAGATALKRIPCFAYSIARLRMIEFRPPLVIMWNRAIYAKDRLIGKRRGDAYDAP